MTELQQAQYNAIVNFACSHFGTTKYVINRTRQGPASYRQTIARSFVRYMMHKYIGMSLTEIAKEFGYSTGHKDGGLKQQIAEFEEQCRKKSWQHVDPVEKFILKEREYEAAMRLIQKSSTSTKG